MTGLYHYRQLFKQPQPVSDAFRPCSNTQDSDISLLYRLQL
jgi:hypothetical protein